MPPRRRKGAHSSSSSRSNRSGHSHSKSTNSCKHSPPTPTPDQNPANVCSICAEKVQDWAVGHCGHTVCGDCSHRMRVLYNRNTCVMCNALLKQVVVVPLRHYRPEMSFDSAVAIQGAFLDRQVNMWFIDRSRYQYLKNVRGWKCSHKCCNAKPPQDTVFANSTLLRAHARSEHRAIYCEICFTGEKSFVSEMPLYPLDPDKNYSSRLRSHLRKEHPQCRFCRHYFLDDEKLYAHLQEKHETCSICERNGRMHEYYINYAELERHFQKEHYICQNEACRGLVFATQIELQAHQHTRHNDASRHSRARALRVNLQQLHGERDPRQRNVDSDADVQRERDRQAARRRAFLSSSVIFSGALTVNEPPDEPVSDEPSTPSQSTLSQSRSTASASNSLSRSTDATAEIRRPDDGKFHPLALPRDGEESQARNTLLVRSMRSLLDPASYEQFRMSSGQFHSGKMSADEYYDAVVDTFGVRSAVRDILPELVALLPTPLLREPLLETCMRRTDTKSNEMSQIGSSASSEIASSSSTRGSNEEEQFPTLNGAPAPRRAVPPARRLRRPGPEDFPRLGKVNKPAGDQACCASPTVNTSGASSSSCRSGSSRPPSGPTQLTAAAVLRQPAHTQRVFGNQRVNTAPPRRNPVPGAQLPASAFPSLSSSSVSSSTTVTSSYSSSGGESSTASSAGPPSDVSMRVGAVWGGAASASQSRGKKRGPGRGQGRRPATPPKHTVVVASADEFPDIRATSESETGASSSSRDRDEHNSSRHPQVLDVMEVAKSRKAAVAKSNLPKIGGSGYGFAWERKKAQQKKKEIKKSIIAEKKETCGGSRCAASASDAGKWKDRDNAHAAREETNNFVTENENEEREQVDGLRLASDEQGYCNMRKDAAEDDSVSGYFRVSS